LLRTTDVAGKYRSHVIAFAPPVAVPLLTNPPTDPASGTPRATDALRITVAAAGGYARRAKTGRVVIAGVAGPDVPAVQIALQGTVSRAVAKLEVDVTPSSVAPVTVVSVRRPGDVRRWLAAFPTGVLGARDDTTGLLQGRNALAVIDAAGRGATQVEIGIPAAGVVVPSFDDPGPAVELVVDAAPIAPTAEQIDPDGRRRRTHVYSATVTGPGEFEVRTLPLYPTPIGGASPLDTSVEVVDVTEPDVAKQTVVASGDDDGAGDGGEFARVRLSLAATAATTLEVRVSSWGRLDGSYRIALVRLP
jgi:hypothetical protein